MKRTISLVLCLTILLGLLTGLAGATDDMPNDKVPELSTTLHQMEDVASLTGSEDFNITLGEVEITSQNATVYFTNPKLGRLIAMSDMPDDYQYGTVNNWVWERNSSYPNEEGELVVLYDGEQYSLPVSTGDAWIGLYTEEGGYDWSFIPRGEAHIPYPNNGSKTIYVKLNDNYSTISRATAQFVDGEELIDAPSCLMTGMVTNNVIPITIQNVAGEHTVKLQVYDQNDNRLMHWNLRLFGEDSDVLSMTQGDSTDEVWRIGQTSLFGSQGINIRINGSPIPSNDPAYEVYFTGGYLGSIVSARDTSRGWQWTWDRNSAMPMQHGYLVVEHGEETYNLFVSTGLSEYGIYTDPACDTDSYLNDLWENTFEYVPGEPLSVYLRAYGDVTLSNVSVAGQDFASMISVSVNEQQDCAVITFHPEKDTTGNYQYQVRFFDPWNNEFSIDLIYLEPDNSTLRIVDDAGNRRYYDSMGIPGSTGFCLQYLNENEEWVNLYPGNGKVYLAAAGENGQLDLDNADKLGLLTEHNEHWEWNLRSADPYVKGYLCAEIPGYDEVFCTKIGTGKLMAPMYDEDTYLRPDSNGIIYYEYETGDQIELHMEFDPEMAANYQKINLSYSKNHPGIKANVDDDKGGVTITFDTTGLSGLYTMELNVDLTSPLEGNMDSHCWNVIRFVQTVNPPSMDLAEIPDYVNYSPEEHFYFAPIQVGEKTYYLAVAGVDHTPENALTNPVKGDTMMWGNGTHWTPYAVMFFEDVNGVAVRIPEDKLQDILGTVENVDLNIYAIKGRDGEPGWAGTSKLMPHTYKGDSRWMASRIYNFTHDSVGDYLLVASARVNGQMYYGYSPIHMMKMVTELQTVSSVEEANQIMAEHGPNSFTETLVLSFEGVTELHGTLQVPLGLGVTLHGDSRNGTTLYGGVCSDSGGYVENFKFKGAGKNQETWPENEHGVIAGTKNYALYGREAMAAGWCTFIGYDTAVYIGKDAPGCHFGGSHNTYMDNRVGIYVDYYLQGGGQGSRENNKFIGNDIAIWLNHVEYMDMDFFRLRNAWFINNGVDIKNETNRLCWLPMCYFLHSNDKVDLNNPGHHSDKQSNHWQPVIEGVLDNNKKTPSVIASPAAVDPFFEDMSYFYPKHIYVYPAMRALYPIVDLDAEMTVTALSEEENEIASVNLTADAVQTQGLSLMNDGGEGAATAEAAFDSTMTRIDEEGEVTLTLAAIPEGYTATVEVPCEGWTEAVVLFGDMEVEGVTVSGGVVRFPAATSEAATYTIIRDNFVSGLVMEQNGEETQTIPEGEFRISGTLDLSPEVEEKIEQSGEQPMVMVAGYTKEGKMVLGEIPILEDGSFDLTVNNAGNLHNLKVFLLNSMENLLPINGAQMIGKP